MCNIRQLWGHEMIYRHDSSCFPKLNSTGLLLRNLTRVTIIRKSITYYIPILR